MSGEDALSKLSAKLETAESVVSFRLPLADDMHVHLRQGAMMKAVTPSIRSGGCSRVLVMPNLTPPVTSSARAEEYKKELEALDPSVQYLMTLYLSPEIDKADLARAKEVGVVGVKSYPRGVTTNSEAGVESYEGYYPIFEEMERLGLILHLHGEVPGESVLDAEARFLPNLEKLHKDFPSLRIILEHVTTKAAVEVVKKLGPSVGATVTAHHLEITIDDVVGCSRNFCKPVAKRIEDREAIRSVVLEGNPKFFLGSDSAPHPTDKKNVNWKAPAGVFTTPYLLQYVADTLTRLGALHRLPGFACEFGARFFRVTPKDFSVSLTEGEGKTSVPCVELRRGEFEVPSLFGEDTLGVDGAALPFRAGEKLLWTATVLS
mmetsp:Transcript_53804/g.105241  ORF Transcript_53804/g.105241 Transcript_53804/m.105241 type:complete len:376 (+) Transcript_53804:252-1379(+)